MSAGELQKLREKRERIERRMRQIQSRQKALDRKARTHKLILWGIVVEGLLQDQILETEEWISACKKYLKSDRQKSEATANLLSCSSEQAHLPVFPAEKQCGPAAG